MPKKQGPFKVVLDRISGPYHMIPEGVDAWCYDEKGGVEVHAQINFGVEMKHFVFRVPRRAVLAAAEYRLRSQRKGRRTR